MAENQPNFGSQNGKAKSESVSEIVRKHGLDYEGWRYIAKNVRQNASFTRRRRAGSCPAF